MPWPPAIRPRLSCSAASVSPASSARVARGRRRPDVPSLRLGVLSGYVPPPSASDDKNTYRVSQAIDWGGDANFSPSVSPHIVAALADASSCPGSVPGRHCSGFLRPGLARVASLGYFTQGDTGTEAMDMAVDTLVGIFTRCASWTGMLPFPSLLSILSLPAGVHMALNPDPSDKTTPVPREKGRPGRVSRWRPGNGRRLLYFP